MITRSFIIICFALATHPAYSPLQKCQWRTPCLQLRGGDPGHGDQGGKAGWRARKQQKKKEAQQPAIPLEPPSGTRDFFPEELRVRTWLFAHFRAVARLFGFLEYDAPVLEHEILYTRKAGEEITAQMYNFVDKAGYNVTLRPEMTPSLARMVLSRGKELLLPLKWFSIPQCWRFENMQRGRKREHYQWNMDVVGVSSVAAEGELISAIATLLQRLGLTSRDVGIRINSRKVLAAIVNLVGMNDALSFQGEGSGTERERLTTRSNVGGAAAGEANGERFAAICVALDKLDKIGKEAVHADLTRQLGLSSQLATALVEAASCRSVTELRGVLGPLLAPPPDTHETRDSAQVRARVAPEQERGGGDSVDARIVSAGAVGEAWGVFEEAVSEVESLFSLLRSYGVEDWVTFDPSVVRGLVLLRVSCMGLCLL